ncbi:MAG: 1-acyl-sn-glycerol-3-phosphate acyltransferase [Chloroflexi bacterium]|uniref:1-acyl-sn-glycerol-3-phosphate acyltransferase n=1 Tax=Candidatus Chlorohelix allophototropha TaxID=3003348 RepID=A0A8T7LSW5_9CHLR|nr:1-acyl-sn-glycerol-3-phosphate acyltransferase [Chloroflexota bacterium]WJW66993.1 1-acyl-sn-glycerol-3-phosphate acyltransferase [Chloroflexota bacterium L227-S17]
MQTLFRLGKKLVDLTPIPFWFAQGRRELRQRYRDGVSILFYAASETFFDVEIRGRKNFTFTPGTLIACSHKRDADVAIVIPHLYNFRRPTRQRRMRGLYEVTRDDFMEKGFLVAYFPWLDWARPVLARINIARPMRDLQTCPVKLPDEQTISQLLQETIRIEGNLKAIEAIEDEWRVKMLGTEANNPRLTLKDAFLRAPLALLSQYATPRIFKEHLYIRIRERHYQLMKQQLHGMTRILERGGSIFIFPEGKVTPNGRFGKIRAALTRVVQGARTEVRMLPANVTYDYMDSVRRPKAIMVIGKEITNIKSFPKNELADLVGKEIAGLAVLTMSGLASRYLLEAVENGKDKVHYAIMRDELWNQLCELKATGLEVDMRLETRAGFEKRLQSYIHYCKSKGGIFLSEVTRQESKAQVRDSEWLALDVLALNRKECHKPGDHPVLYCANELMSLLEARDLVEEQVAETDNVISFQNYRRQGNAV